MRIYAADYIRARVNMQQVQSGAAIRHAMDAFAFVYPSTQFKPAPMQSWADHSGLTTFDASGTRVVMRKMKIVRNNTCNR